LTTAYCLLNGGELELWWNRILQLGITRHRFNAFFTLNGSWLSLYRRGFLAEDVTVSPEGGGFNGFTLANNLASEPEAEQVIEQAVAAGATF
jgi:hypothetical protein